MQLKSINRVFCILICLVLLTMLVGACAPSPASTTSAPPTTTPPATSVTTTTTTSATTTSATTTTPVKTTTTAPAKTYTFTVAGAWGIKDNDGYGALHLINSVNEKCITQDGKVEYKWVGGPETFKATDLPDVCKAGSVDLFLTTSAYLTGLVPEVNVTQVPYGWSDETVSELWKAGFADIMAEAFQKKGLKVLSLAFATTYIIFTTGSFAKLGNLKGKTMRAPGGLLSTLLTYLGATPVSLATAEVYGAMQRKVIDGGLQAYASYALFSYWEVAPYVLDHEFATLGGLWLGNPKKFNELPASLQAKLLEIHAEEGAYTVDWYHRVGNVATIDAMKAHGVQFISLSSEDNTELLNQIRKLKNEAALTKVQDTANKAFAILDKFVK